jgi:hypothetical protein
MSYFPIFLYKRYGTRKVYISRNRPTTLTNKYIQGSGIGGSSISTRRAKMRLASTCRYMKHIGRNYTRRRR